MTLSSWKFGKCSPKNGDIQNTGGTNEIYTHPSCKQSKDLHNDIIRTMQKVIHSLMKWLSGQACLNVSGPLRFHGEPAKRTRQMYPSISSSSMPGGHSVFINRLNSVTAG